MQEKAERNSKEILDDLTKRFGALMLMQLDDLIAKQAKVARRKKSKQKHDKQP